MAPFSPGAHRPVQPGDSASTTSPAGARKLRVTGADKVERDEDGPAVVRLSTSPPLDSRPLRLGQLPSADKRRNQ
ncbi:hypothetical protein JCM3770_004802 [Rhodotorula araucariae]